MSINSSLHCLILVFLSFVLVSLSLSKWIKTSWVGGENIYRRKLFYCHFSSLFVLSLYSNNSSCNQLNFLYTTRERKGRESKSVDIYSVFWKLHEFNFLNKKKKKKTWFIYSRELGHDSIIKVNVSA